MLRGVLNLGPLSHMLYPSPSGIRLPWPSSAHLAIRPPAAARGDMVSTIIFTV